MGCVASFNKHCDVCICLLNEYKGQINNHNNIRNKNNKSNNLNRTSTFYKRKLNDAFEKLNKDVKHEYELTQLKELNEIYQKLLSLDSARNKHITIDNNDIDLYNVNSNV